LLYGNGWPWRRGRRLSRLRFLLRIVLGSHVSASHFRSSAEPLVERLRARARYLRIIVVH
jgi:hypothetical protein